MDEEEFDALARMIQEGFPDEDINDLIREWVFDHDDIEDDDEEEDE